MEYTINIKGRLMDLSTPQVMGILNVTPDSFYSGSRKQTEMEIAQRANQIIEEGGSIIKGRRYLLMDMITILDCLLTTVP